MAKLRYTPKFLEDLEQIFIEAGYWVRYEKGNFQSGYCVLNQQRVVVVNKYFPLDGKINCLVDILKTVDWDFAMLTEKTRKLYNELNSPQLSMEL
jgi:hypothetical protein